MGVDAMKTLAVGVTLSGAYWTFLFDTREEALVFVDAANMLPKPDHEAWHNIHWDLVEVETTTVAEAIKQFREY
jgi:hypothetical protein